MSEKPNDQKPAAWAIVELLGHVKLAGKLSEEEKFGTKMGRLDIPTTKDCSLAGCESHAIAPDECPECGGWGKVDDFVTQYFGGQSVYRITYVTEQVARHVAKGNQPEPVHSWDFPKQLQAAPPANTTGVFTPEEDETPYGQDDS